MQPTSAIIVMHANERNTCKIFSIIIQLIFLQQYFPIPVPCNITRYYTAQVLLHGPQGYAVS